MHKQLDNAQYMEEKLDNTFTDRNRLMLRLGNANWRAFSALEYNIEKIFLASDEWKKELAGVEKPWLCWNISNDWCLAQQKIVHSVGWTPIVGFDSRIGMPKDILPESILIDFNSQLKLPLMYMHFPLEFVFRFTDKLAFWHSDLLIKPEKMKILADSFSKLKDGEIAITKPKQRNVLASIYNETFHSNKLRYFELIGCITKSASKDMYKNGCGFWQGWSYHPNCPSETEFKKRKNQYWDHGTGIRYWHKHYKSRNSSDVKLIDEGFIDEGHFSRIKIKDFKVLSPMNESRNSGLDLDENFSVSEALRILGMKDI